MFGSTEFEHFSVAGNDLYLGLTGIGKVQAAMKRETEASEQRLRSAREAVADMQARTLSPTQ